MHPSKYPACHYLMWVPVFCGESDHLLDILYVQRSQRMAKSNIQIHSLREIHRRSTPPKGDLYVTVIRNNVSGLRSAGGPACTAGRPISSCSNYTMMMPSLIRRCAIGTGRSSWAGSMSKTQEGLAEPPISVFSFEFRVHSRRCHLPLFDAFPRPCTLLQQLCFTF
jgi:hypothetical protein